MSTIDRYQILGELGKGGMAIVYRAYDPRFGREVALKVLPGHFLHNSQLRQRFKREAKIIASLEHPAIVPVYDFGEYNGQPFLVMRLMGGGSLKERLKSGPLPLTEVIRIISHLAPGLDQAHVQGIVHRDLKPGNILFDQHNRPYITDFGIAKQSQATRHLTVTGTVMGTPEYMSPEQARGESNLSGRSDIYSFGIIFFQMLTGHVPYKADTPMGTALRHVTDPVPRINEVCPDLPARFAYQPIINRAMAKLPQARYPTAAALSADLTPPPAPPPPPLPPPPPPPPGKWAKIAGIVGILGLVACICLAIFGSFIDQTPLVVRLTATPTVVPVSIQRPEATATIATPTTTSTATPQVQQTATIQAIATIAHGIGSNALAIHGPTEGSLVHSNDNSISLDIAEVGVRDFWVAAKFLNPYSTAVGTWSVGFLFRHEGGDEQFRLIINSDENWALQNHFGGSYTDVAIGPIPNLDLSANGSNTFALVANGDTGYLNVNDQWITMLDLSARMNAGDIAVGTGFFQGSQLVGQTTLYEDFTIWSINETPVTVTVPADALLEEAPSELLFSDDFFDASRGWNLDSDENLTLAIEDGQYHITVIKDNWTARASPGQSFDDFTLQVETTQVEGPDDNGYGVALRYVDDDNFYWFGISGIGFYQFAKWQDGELSALITWTKSSAINLGQATNLIKVVCEGDTFTFFVNGEFIKSVSDSSFDRGDIGLFASKAENESDVHISFDNLNVWAIE